jgi:hypothetical protein
MLATCETAQAIPILQLYVEGGTYDASTDQETWVSSSSDGVFRIWTIGNVSGGGGKGPIYGVKLSAVYSSSLNLTIQVNGSQVPTVNPWGVVDPTTAANGTYIRTSADGEIPVLGDGSSLPSHGQYSPGKTFQEFALGDFTETSSSLADFIGTFPSSFTLGGQINVYDVVITGLNDGDIVHFDLYNHVQSMTKGKIKKRYVNAPFSHDGEGEYDPPEIFEVPEPGSMTLLLTGALGAAFAGRRRRSAA